MRKTLIAIGMFLLLPLSAAFAQGGGPGIAMSPVGVWDFEVVDSSGAVQKALVTFYFGGTATVTANGFLSSYGSWQKTGDRSFVVSFYAIITDEVTGEHIGYFNGRVENTLVDKDTIEGRTEGWFLVGTDPFNPQGIFPVSESNDLGRRLRAEGPS